MRTGLGGRAALLMALTALTAIIFGCSDDSGTDPTEPQEVILGTWYLSTDGGLSPRIEYLADLVDTLNAYGLQAEAAPDQEFRLGLAESVDYLGEPVLIFRDWIRTQALNRAELLDERTRAEVGPAGLVLSTAGGLDDASLADEIEGSYTWLDTLLPDGGFGEVFAFRSGIHDLPAMEALRDAGYIAARSHEVSYRPWGAFLLGPPDGEGWLDGWAQLSLYELAMSIDPSDIQALDPAAVDDWLAAPEQLPSWKDARAWVHIKTKTDDASETGTPIIDADHLEALLDVLQNDGDVWIAPVGEIARYVRDSHVASEGNLVWSDAAGGDQPWNGHACAFSFSTIEGFSSNVDAFEPAFATRGLSYTAFLCKATIDVGDTGYTTYLNSDQVRQLAQEGVEIGSMGLNHQELLSDQALVVEDPGDAAYYLEIFSEGGNLQLRLSQIR